MKQPVNRIEAEITQWQAKEQRLGRLFSTALLASTEFQKEKLAFYEHLSTSFGNGRGLGEQERFALRMAKAEKARLEKQLYPSLFVRLIRTGLKNIFKPVIDHKREINMASNERHLMGIINKMGLHDTSGLLAKQMRRGERAFQVPASTYMEGGKRIDFQLGFELGENGQYRPSHYKASVASETKESISQSFSFGQFGDLNAEQVGNLLEGRAVRQDSKWIQLDHNDKDRDGNCRVKQFYPQYGFDVEKALADWPVKGLASELEKQEILRSLHQGNNAKVILETSKGTQQVTLQVNPQFKTLTALNDKGQKVSLAQVAGKGTARKQSPGMRQKPMMRVSKVRKLSVG